MLEVQCTRDAEGAGPEGVIVVLRARRRVVRIIGIGKASLVVRGHVCIQEIVYEQRDLPAAKTRSGAKLHERRGGQRRRDRRGEYLVLG